jgi:hypothetical protein
MPVSNGSRKNWKWLQLFHHINFAISPVAIGMWKCDTSCVPLPPRFSPVNIGKHEERNIQPIKNQEKITNKILRVRKRGKDLENRK